MKNELSKMIAAYSGMASAILVVQQSNAQIIYTDPPDIHLNGYGSSASIDLNNDGIYDYNFAIQDPHISVPYGTIDVDYNTANGVFQVMGQEDNCASSGYYNAIMELRSGRKINRKIPYWMKLEHKGDLLNLEESALPFCNTWAGLKDHYIGVRFFPAPPPTNKFYYGWIRLSISGDGTKMLIKDWAYNSILNGDLVAGQMQKVSQLSSASNLRLDIYSSAKQIFINQNSQNLPLEISVYNLLGEEVKHINSPDSEVMLNAEDLSGGIYIVHVKSDRDSFSKEVVIQ